MAAPMKVGHVGKTTHQPQQRTGIGLTDFHGNTNHTRVFAKMSRNFKIHVTNFDKYEFVLGEKMAHGTRGPGIGLSDSSDMPIENQSLHM